MNQFVCPECNKDVYPITLKVIRMYDQMAHQSQYWHEVCFDENSNPSSAPSGRPVQESKDGDSHNPGLGEGEAVS